MAVENILDENDNVEPEKESMTWMGLNPILKLYK